MLLDAHVLHQMMQTMVDGMVMVDREGQIVYANPAAERILDLRQDAILGRYYNVRTWRQVDAEGSPYPLDRLPLAVAMRELREVCEVEHGIIDAEDNLKWLSVNAAPLLDEEGVLYGAIANFRDITERWHARAELEARVEARTAELVAANRELEASYAQRQDVQAQLMESAKMAALGQLAASVAHEINNPLQSIQGCIALTREELAGPRRQEKFDRYLEVVEEEIDRIAAIVEQMRTFYRPAKPHREPVDLHTVLEGVLELTHSQMQRQRVTLDCRWAESLPAIQANPDQLRQVALNLILNALDAMPQGGTLHIHTALAQMPDGAPTVQAMFRDDGDGIVPEELPHIFEPFFTTKPHGSGLGLAISYNIIEAHGGQMTVQSQPDKGTTFTIALPMV